VFKRERALAGQEEEPLNPVLLVLASGCGYVARTHAGNLPHLRETFREAIRHEGFSFVHVLAGCVTYQKPSYAESVYRRCETLPAGYDPTDLARAMETARHDERFALGVIYRREEAAVAPS
jgi:2-oxoglutarate ferredoxin oxidoreductase subunit beta